MTTRENRSVCWAHGVPWDPAFKALQDLTSWGVLGAESAGMAHPRRGSHCGDGLRRCDVCKLVITNSSRDGVLTSWKWITRLVSACVSSTRGGFLFCVISFVLGWPWILRLSQSHSRVWGSVKGKELRGNWPLVRVSTCKDFKLCGHTTQLYAYTASVRTTNEDLEGITSALLQVSWYNFETRLDYVNSDPGEDLCQKKTLQCCHCNHVCVSCLLVKLCRLCSPYDSGFRLFCAPDDKAILISSFEVVLTGVYFW